MDQLNRTHASRWQPRRALKYAARSGFEWARIANDDDDDGCVSSPPSKEDDSLIRFGIGELGELGELGSVRPLTLWDLNQTPHNEHNRI